MRQKKIDLIGACLGLGAGHYETALGPRALLEKGLLSLVQNVHATSWQLIQLPEINPSLSMSFAKKRDNIYAFNQELAKLVSKSLEANHFPMILGGDHSIAIGTWQGVTHALKAQREFGLIWFDAHMDAHTPQTSHSGNIHGMPLAALMGLGDKKLVNLLNDKVTLNPSHVVLIGVRSYESEEAALLADLNVKVFYMEEIREKGLDVIVNEALNYVTKDVKGFGISFDVDVFDPQIAMGTGTPFPDGLFADEVLKALQHLASHPLYTAIEITEFNPKKDVADQTLKLVESVVLSSLPRASEKKNVNH